MSQVVTCGETLVQLNDHSSLNCSPFKALYDTEPNLGGLPYLSSALPDDVMTCDLDWAAHTDLLHAQLSRV